ncbi:MAG: YggT family protein [Gammaproteobacteria bacterium]|nr:YggT family protein [Gammaproteobacteria bacterium]NNJ78255.1 YggT family protein [Xanthomonadales bacterium]
MNASAAVSYLVSTLISLYVTAVLLRLLLQWVRADFYNPVCQFLVKVTNPVLVPLRRVIPSIGRLDTASVVLMLVLESISIWFMSLFSPLAWGAGQIVLFAAVSLVAMLLWTYFILIIAMVILSWVGGGVRHPIVPLIYQLIEPVLRPLRRIIPPIAGIDLSPLFALIIIRFLLLMLGR